MDSSPQPGTPEAQRSRLMSLRRTKRRLARLLALVAVEGEVMEMLAIEFDSVKRQWEPASR